MQPLGAQSSEGAGKGAEPEDGAHARGRAAARGRERGRPTTSVRQFFTVYPSFPRRTIWREKVRES